FAFFDVAASPGIRRAPMVLAPIAMLLKRSIFSVASLALVPFVDCHPCTRFDLLPMCPVRTIGEHRVVHGGRARAKSRERSRAGASALGRCTPGGFELFARLRAEALDHQARTRVDGG